MKTGVVIPTLNRISKLLDHSQRRGGILLIIGIIINALFNVLGLAAVLPVITVSMKPEIIQEYEILRLVYETFHFSTINQFLLFLVVLMFGLFVLKNVFGMAMVYFQAKYSTNLALDLSRKKYILYLQKGYQIVKDIDSGNYIANVKDIPTHFARYLMIPLASFLSEIVVVLIILLGITIYNVKLILIMGTVMGAGFVIFSRLTRKSVQRIGEQQKVVRPKIIAWINQTIQGYVDIHIFNKSRYFLDVFIKDKSKENHFVKLHAFLSMLPPNINETIAILGIVIVFVYGIFFAEGKNDLLILLSLFAAAAYRVMPSMNRMLANLVSIKSYLYTLDILEHVKGMSQELPNPNLQPLPFEKEIEFSGLSFSFEDSATPVLDEITFTVPKGHQIGLIGSSGSGKTTLMRLLLRLYHEQGGCIKIDGVPITTDNEQAWVQNIGFVQQQVFVIDGTMLENVAFGDQENQVDEERAIQALKQARLWDFVSQLPDGIHTAMGEFGSKLSGGQRQRVAIARALYKNASVFIFDEATSALDPETEQMITESIDALARTGKTIFLIAHRFTTLQSCDIIYELDQGKIIQEYQYDTLIKEKLGLVKETN